MASELPDSHSGLTVTGITSAASSLNLWEGPELDAPSHQVPICVFLWVFEPFPELILTAALNFNTHIA